jgi:hypothetical protein
MAVQLDTAPVVIICALEQEVAVLRRLVAGDPGIEICVSGPGAVAAEQVAQQRLQRRPRPALVIAAGFCGALRPGVPIAAIVSDDQIQTVPQILATPQHKQLWARRSAAWAVDLESAAIRQVCRRYQVPCRVIRAVSDRWNEAIPNEVVEELSLGGRWLIRRWLRRLTQRPLLLLDLVRLWLNSRRAARCLAIAVLQAVRQSSPRQRLGRQR